uniref:Uncharacterized protein n=1 Tax=Anopheles farauti TaxID=69004 RepID=A0A182QAN4_9DIPT
MIITSSFTSGCTTCDFGTIDKSNRSRQRNDLMVRDESFVQLHVRLRQYAVVVRGPVAHLIVTIHLAAVQQYQHVRQQIRTARTELCDRSDGRRTDGCVLQYDAVVDEACPRPASFASGFSSMISMIVSTIEVLYSSPPSSRSMPLRKFIVTACFRGNLVQSERMACTTTSLNSSEISATKVAICFISRSTELSAPVFRSVVMASVATERFESAISPSKSRLHTFTAGGCSIATLFIVRTAAKRSVALEEPQNSCRMLTAVDSSRGFVRFRFTMAWAASYTTISDLLRRLHSTKLNRGDSSIALPLASSSSMILHAIRIRKHVAYGLRRFWCVSLYTSLPPSLASLSSSSELDIFRFFFFVVLRAVDLPRLDAAVDDDFGVFGSMPVAFAKRRQQVRAGDGDKHVDVVNNVQRLVLHRVREVGQIVRQVQHLPQADLTVVELLRDRLDERTPLGLGAAQQRVQETVQRRRRFLRILHSIAAHDAGLVTALEQLLQLVRQLHAGVRFHIYKARILLVDLLQMPVRTVCHLWISLWSQDRKKASVANTSSQMFAGSDVVEAEE